MPDTNDWNEDWIKTRSWDIRLGSALVTTVAQLEKVVPDVRAFMKTPAAAAMPAKLRAEVELRYPGATLKKWWEERTSV